MARGLRILPDPIGRLGSGRGLSVVGGGEIGYTIDFSTLPNGSLPGALPGATWSVVSGRAYNSPSLGTETLTDGGLEANYTGGRCDTLTSMAGSPTLVQSADAHGGSKAQQFTAAASGDSIGWSDVAGGATVGYWYLLSLWTKRAAGTAGTCGLQLSQGGGFVYKTPITSAAYSQLFITGRNISGASLTNAIVEAHPVAHDTVIFDDGSFRPITLSSAMSLYESGANYGDVHGMFSQVANTHCGVVMCADSRSDPKYFLLATHDGTSIALSKCVNGTYTDLISPTGAAYGADRDIAIHRVFGTNTFQLFYNGVQVGTDQTVADAGIVGNTLHGLFSIGPENGCSKFTYYPNAGVFF
jgi:hypothetical protein